ncbi:MAG TPA: FAD binding domain-containing protein [Thermoanaerobaculia bacterium]|nr:FAD binding domain-containing protein [Thermoanaerobaculia bacterium]
MRLPRFRYFAPKTIREALKVKSGEGPESAFVAGGTDLYPNMKRRQQTPPVVIGLSRIAALRRLRASADAVSIGACVPLSEIENHRRVRRALPALAHAIEEISTPPLRNMGTLGGNVLLDTRCNYYDQNYEWRQAIDFCMKKDGAICWVAPGSPKCLAIQSADSVPVLIALDARVVLAGPSGEREIPVESLYRNDGIHYLTKEPDELLTEIRIPLSPGRTAAYRKLRRRGSFDFPVLSVGAALRSEGGVVTDARIVLGAVASAPVRASAAEARLVGRPLDGTAIEEAAAVAAGPARPMDNTDFSFLWRKEMTRKWVADALRAAGETRGAA